jgi:hypothetical protein
MNVKAPTSPVKAAHTKAALNAGQPWFLIGILLDAVSGLASVAAGHSWISSSLRLPFMGLQYVGVAVAVYGVIRMFRWKKANPLSQFDQGARS